MLSITPEVWKAGLRTATAAGAALVLSQLLSLPEGYWTVITSIVIMQANLGASLAAAGDRLLGTFAGAALGFVVARLTPSTALWTLAGLVLATALLAMLAMRFPSFRIAPVTAAILLISAPSHADPSLSAIHRVTEIGVGCIIGIAVSLLVAPSRAELRLREEINRALALLADLVAVELEGPESKTGDAAIAAASEDVYAAYATIATLATQTQEEQASRLARGTCDIDRLRRSLRRLRTNVFFLQRVTRQPWPSALGNALVEPTAAVASVTHDYLLALGRAVAAGKPSPPLDELEQVFGRFAAKASAAVHEAKAGVSPAEADDAATSGASDHAIAFVSAFSFALEQLRLSIEGLVEWVDDMSGKAAYA
jgi:uncharacterized membrane protein YccC